MTRLTSVFALAMLLGLGACSSTSEIDRSQNTDLDPLAEPQYGPEGAPRATENGEDLDLGVEIMGVEVEEGRYPGSALGEDEMTEGGKLYEPIVYFEFDQADLSEANTELVKHYAQVLVDAPEKNVTLVGHTDERGSPEYNLALGERRAKSVAQVMMLFGVQESRIELISFGEEQPQALEHNEQAWLKNRRVEIKIN